ncbi:MAG: alanine--tRNA ligase [Nanoarchaeota archaeon]
MITRKQLIKKYLDFFKEKKHGIIPSAPLVPENDPTILFTTAGMHPLVPYLLGQPHPLGKRIADNQKCIRTIDIEGVGDNRHMTFFEMLGNWSLGDYFKQGAIEMSFEFLTSKKWLGLDPKRIYVTVFKGDENSPLDEESINCWKEQFKKFRINAKVCGYNEEINGNEELRIFPLPAKDNWWGPAGQTGPCGPCTEIFYDVSPEKGVLQDTFDEEVDKFRIMEIWNNVFMEFDKDKNGNFEKMKMQNVDTGMGVERTIAILNHRDNAFDTDSFEKIIEKIEKISGKKYEGNERAMRIIADHIKAATFIIADGITPGNTDQGYILRRLIRRAIRYGKELGMENFTPKIAEAVFEIYDDYPELEEHRKKIMDELEKEEERFDLTLDKGLSKFNKFISDKKELSGEEAFLLYQSYGFPIEMTEELAKEKGIKVDIKEFNKEFEKHQELSRTAAEGKFKSGLADHSEATTKLHTATHLLMAALRDILKDENIVQKGSNITPQRLRLDFNFDRKLTKEEIEKIEDLVNAKIQESCEVRSEEMTPKQAKEKGAVGVFEGKYGDKVSVYSVDDFSCEICAGPHVKNTCELGHFKIKKEESSSSGVRRIKAVLE